MDVRFLGAAQTVTGSMHLVRTARASVLLDCGLFQGRRGEARERNAHLPFDPSGLDAVVLSHAHIDHSGALPMLPKQGCRGPVVTTPATRDLAAVMLEDAALIQEADARHVNEMIARGELDGDPVEPLYTPDDVVALLSMTQTLPYHRASVIAPGVTLTMLDAGHVLGSAIVVLDLEDGEGPPHRLVFSGDLGRKGMPILRDPEVPTGAQTLLLESTYGDRSHPPREAMDAALAEVIHRVSARGGKIFIPSFALERAQEIVLSLKKLRAVGAIPALPIYVDSPLTAKVTDVFRLHPECFDADMRSKLLGSSPFDMPELRYVTSTDDSKAITASDAPAIVIAGSGMCESGRILHHLRASVGDPRSAVVIVGFQAPHTLGRRLVERRDRVRIFGVELERRAEIVVLNGFSAHAGQDELVAFGAEVAAKGSLTHVALVHGEPPAQRVLASLLGERGVGPIVVPAQGDRLMLR